MKKISLLFLIYSCINMNVYSQNRIKSWELKEIYSISVEINSPNSEKEAFVFNSRKDINKIIKFLSEAEFKDYNDRNAVLMDSAKDNYIKIICEGQRDQIYLYQRMALIGKSSFLIKEDMILNFKILVKSL